LKPVILIPFRPAEPERERNLGIVLKWWTSTGFSIFVGDDKREKSFQRTHARNAVAREAGDWDVAIFCDADVLLASVQQAEAAMMRCYRTGAYTVCYSSLRYLNELGTKYLLKGGSAANADYEESVGLTWECCFAVRRDIWDQVGGFDERFRGYGGQVAAFFYAAATFGGRERILGNAYHLSHPLVNRKRYRNFQKNLDLAERYKKAVDNRQKMLQILGERGRA
jgi:predicted glycosyltransferase involved in capsule biosynthesis